MIGISISFPKLIHLVVLHGYDKISFLVYFCQQFLSFRAKIPPLRKLTLNVKLHKYIFLNPYPRLCLILERGREREREKERETLMWGRNIDQLPSVHILTGGSNLQPMYVPWQRIEPTAFWFMAQCSNQLSHLARAHQYI